MQSSPDDLAHTDVDGSTSGSAQVAAAAAAQSLLPQSLLPPKQPQDPPTGLANLYDTEQDDGCWCVTLVVHVKL